MASIGASVKKSIDDWELGDLEFSMLHACNAVDGTAKKAYPGIAGSNQRFTKLLRDHYGVLGPMGAPGVDLINTRWPVQVDKPKAPGGFPDFADVIYGIHRCTHGHGQELPAGFELIPDAAGPTSVTQIFCEKGRVRLSDRVIFGLLGVVVLNPVNVGKVVPPTYYLSFGEHKLLINQWWGRLGDFHALASGYALPNVKLDFGDWYQP